MSLSPTTANFPSSRPDWMPPEWYAFFMALLYRTGGPGSPIDILTLQKQDEISQDVPPQNAATMWAQQGVNDLWAEQRPPENLTDIRARLAALEEATPTGLDVGPILQRLNDIESLLAEIPRPRDPAVNAPSMNGAAATGSLLRFAREDHVHPTDTTRAPLASPSFTGVVTAPVFETATATQAAATSGTAYTLYTFANTSPQCWLVFANIGLTNDTTHYDCFAVVLTDGSSARIALSNFGTNMTVTLSGLALQVTQSSGGAQPINVVLTRIG